MTVRLDHIALAVPRLADVEPFLVGVLGGAYLYGDRSRVFSFGQWRFRGGGRLEILEPLGDDGFLHRFLAQHGSGVHHVTFHVPSLRDACARAEAHGYDIVGLDESDPDWKEAFLHPKQALGVVVQLAETTHHADDLTPKAETLSAAAASRPAPVTVLGLRLRARSAERADRQWGRVLEGKLARSDTGELVYQWDQSPLRLVVEVDAEAQEGPVAIEIASDRPVDLPIGKHPVLGAVLIRAAHPTLSRRQPTSRLPNE